MNGDGLGSGVLRLRRGRPGWAIPGLLVLAVVFAAALAFNLANLEPGTETVPPTAPAGSSPSSSLGIDGTVLDVLLVVVSGLFLAGILYAVFVLRGRTKRETKARSPWQVLSSLLGLLLVFAVLFAFPRIARIGQTVNRTADSASSGTAGQKATGWGAAAVGTQGGFLLLIIVFITMITK